MPGSAWKNADTPPADDREVLVFGRLEGINTRGKEDRDFLGCFNAKDKQWYQSGTRRKINAKSWIEISSFG
jgi:hypothetical protein